jgi:2-methylcitrate dehydratase PrpD
MRNRPDIDPRAPGLGVGLAADLADLDWTDIPPDLVQKLKLYALDNLGVLGGAAHAAGIAELNAALLAFEPSDGLATVLTTGRRISPPAAAFANGSTAHALDFDDQHDPARIHVLSTVLPAALAASEFEGNISGKQFLTALAIGGELSCRLGLTCHSSLGRGWHPTTALGALAATAAAAKIFRLDARQMLNALAIAFVQMSGTTQSNADGVLTKRMGAGFAARTGLFAAQLARHGLTGPPRFLEGAAGLFALHERGDVTPERLTEALGQNWRIGELSIKPFPCCRAAHTVIELGLKLRKQGLKIENIDSGQILLSRLNWQMVGAPFNPPAVNPVVHAQFNAIYTFVRALLDGRIDLRTFEADQIMAPEMAPARRLHCDETLEIAADAVAPAAVKIRCRDGSELSQSIAVMKGSPENPMSTDEIIQKFRSCLEFGLNAEPDAIERFASVVLDLDRVKNVADLVDAFPTPRRRSP